MGLQCQILLDGTTKEYYSGETISGRVVISSDDSRNVKGLQLKFTGECEVRFSELKNRLERRSNGETICHKRMVTSGAREFYLQSVLDIFWNDDGVTIRPGQVEYPFQYALPENLPSSFDGPLGKIFYSVKAELSTYWGPYCETTTEFRILGIADLSMNNEAQTEGQKITKRKSLGYFSCFFGTANFTLQLEKSGTYVGDYIPFVLEVNNDSDETVGTRLSLIQKVIYRTKRRKRIGTKVECTIVGPSIVSGDFDIWAGNIMQVPPCVPSGLGGLSNLIDVSYELKMEMLVKGSPLVEGGIPVVIGIRPPHPSCSTILPTPELPPSYEMAVICSDNVETKGQENKDSQPPAYCP